MRSKISFPERLSEPLKRYSVVLLFLQEGFAFVGCCSADVADPCQFTDIALLFLRQDRGCEVWREHTHCVGEQVVIP